MPAPRGLYTPIYQSFPRHPKTVQAAKALRVDRHKLMGHLMCLWTWCLHSIPSSGAVLDAETVAIGAEWPERKATGFCEALSDAGFLERAPGGYSVHEWTLYGGKVARTKQHDRDRKAEGSSEENPRNFRGTSTTRRDETRRDEKPPEGSTTKDRLYAVHRALTQNLPSHTDSEQIDGWLASPCTERGCLDGHIGEAESSLAEWKSPPKRPWSAFAKALGSAIASCELGRRSNERNGRTHDGRPVGMPTPIREAL